MEPEGNSQRDNRRGFIRRILAGAGIGSVAAATGVDANSLPNNQFELCERSITTYTYDSDGRLVDVARGRSA